MFNVVIALAATVMGQGAVSGNAVFDFIERNDLTGLQRLLDRNRGLANLKNAGVSPLHRAVALNRIDVMKLLMKYGADPEIKDFNGYSVIDLAIWLERREAIWALIASGNTLRQWHFAALGDLDQFKELFEKTPVYFDDTGNGNTILHWAVIGNNQEIVKLIVAKRNLTNHPGHEHVTPFHLAIRRNKERMVSVLIDHGAGINEPGPRGYFPLHMAVWTGESSLVSLLLANKASPNVQADGLLGVNDPGESCLDTPLHDAVIGNNPPIISLLLGRGANPAVANRLGHTPLDVARRTGNIEAEKMLLFHAK